MPQETKPRRTTTLEEEGIEAHFDSMQKAGVVGAPTAHWLREA
jgi:hypothetical protein